VRVVNLPTPIGSAPRELSRQPALLLRASTLQSVAVGFRLVVGVFPPLLVPLLHLCSHVILSVGHPHLLSQTPRLTGWGPSPHFPPLQLRLAQQARQGGAVRHPRQVDAVSDTQQLHADRLVVDAAVDVALIVDVVREGERHAGARRDVGGVGLSSN
jgi:hypothetical protein